MSITINIKHKNGTEENMPIEEFTRWACLIEAITTIDNMLTEKGIDDDKEWIKPIAIQKYMDEKYCGMLHDMKIEATLGNI